ncbi:MAG: sigma-70 family RNA polymerase sigma factor [Sedimentisphaerales bacterium]|nr:sigma-70 family RNA polymerase sigma factor [Sedimentisphaerales bacterium]
MTHNDDLARIVSGCQDGDAECFSEIVDMYAGRCYGYFYRLTGNRELSDELLSELFVKLVQKVKTYKGGAFEGWLFKIAANIFHDHLRARQRRMKLLDARRRDLESEVTEQKRSESDRGDRLQIQLGKLDSETRELIMLRFYSQMSLKEIAEVRSEPIGTTLSRLHRGLKRLREMMGQRPE